ncbi:MAG: microcin ABC transporter ATP-binding protein [Burkholderiales bacterium 68-12]|nr:MAG: microcin ABC transporter ATP-binding protein [Burkholderiales bacterium 68-12]
MSTRLTASDSTRDDAILRISDLSVALPQSADRQWALQGVNLTLLAGQTLCVVGESGSGKSVLATTIMRLLPRGLKPMAGSIHLQGENLLQATESRMRQLRGEGIGMVFQEPMTALNPVLRCGHQVEELLRQHTSWSATERKARVLEVFSKVRLPEPERIYTSYPHQLSGGQRQRIVIAMAVILKPRLLICDEPTTALDVTTQKEILRLIDELHREQGSAVLFITHDMGVVSEIADQVLVMRNGEQVEFGPRDAVLKSPQQDYTRRLLESVPSMKPPRPRHLPHQPATLRAERLQKTYISHNWRGQKREMLALRGATLEVQPGETLGIVGESGCGKSTLARCCVRLIDPTGGELLWGDTKVDAMPEHQLRRHRNAVQIVFQDPNRSLNPRLTVGQSIVEGARNFGASEAEATSLAQELIRKVRLPVAALDRYPNEFSGGQRQRIAIARALACKPRVLVADEAVSALDVSVQAEIMSLLREVQAEHELALLFITHDLRVAAQLCDRVMVMRHGQVIEEGLTADVYARPQDPYTRELLTAAPRFEPSLEA